LTFPLLEGARVMKTWYSRGEFSQVRGSSVKTLRFYYEKGILVPSSVDEATGYRSYNAGKIEKARIIMRLRAMGFSIEDLGTVLRECDDETDILNHLQRQKNTVQQRIREDRDIVPRVRESSRSDRLV
jgi:DNA-binding transcriptional MerR regulator